MVTTCPVKSITQKKADPILICYPYLGQGNN
ncbi:hypothetical protein JZO67_004634 [Enterococcus sp. 665A]|uniref:Uncharacterized protein n=1 Tax=Candidatus Enterococcus ferrettii TaxID=2815324 RepID=A0ABV0EVG5_9ENTE